MDKPLENVNHKKSNMSFSIGKDFGSNSVRASVVNRTDGFEIGSCVVNYLSGEHEILH